LFDLSVLSTAEDGDLSTALSAINAELRPRIAADGGFASKVHQLYPTAVAVLCDVVWEDLPTASAEGVLLAHDTVISVDEETAPDLWGEIRDDVADLAAVDGAIHEDFCHGHLIRLDTLPEPDDDPSRA
jgi:energy-converting hydrogenase Eha subunit B